MMWVGVPVVISGISVRGGFARLCRASITPTVDFRPGINAPDDSVGVTIPETWRELADGAYNVKAEVHWNGQIRINQIEEPVLVPA